MEQATVYRWNIQNGTGVLTRPNGSPVWFHLSSVAQDDVLTLREGDLVDVEVENTPQGGYESRAISVRRHVT
ncbi:cold shock domain-containing protein [Nocardia transvalensis]|uniref:cold shock domain-containing protein n=1 Tax=Nocardia transvalensis TaxID=37333 RepID=UPI001894F8B5|nr:cold shock domain-containing protein [Nocardia transvalensis]MBF6331111.1 cold shock domain-containing protein [Nocardia transvalensis]